MSRRPARCTEADLKTGHVYFILAAKARAIKIGYSKNRCQRFHDLQTGSPVPLHFYGSVPGNKADETALHQRFKHRRLTGEWFRECNEIYNYIEDLADEFEDHPQQGSR